MWRLAPPKWPEEIFGKIDRVKAAQGKALFATHCASCHNSYPYTWTAPNKYGKRFLEVGLVPKTYMGTDMQQTVVVNKFMYTAQLSPYLPGPDKAKQSYWRQISSQPSPGFSLAGQWKNSN